MVFGQTLRFDFVNYDDDRYVYENPEVAKGLTWRGAGWALTSSHARNWHPLSTITHMADCQLYGLKADGHHFTNVALHTVGVLLVFLLLLQMSGKPATPANLWSSAFVAALFAIHPQHVESVAWVSERKDVLSGIFFILTLLTYLAYARRPSIRLYLVVLFLFLCGLMSKVMLVTLPFVLLLLDYWPLGRFTRRPMGLLLEKAPLFIMSAVASVITYLIQKRHSYEPEALPILWRIENAFVSYATYIEQMFWPRNLAPFYPHPEGNLGLWQLMIAVLLISGVTVLVLLQREKNPYFFTGWFWYLGMLVPVIGLVEAGAQGWADRYTYLPHLGLYIGLTWLIADLTKRWRYRAEILGPAALLVICTLATTSYAQTTSWRDSYSLWQRALNVTKGNHVAHNNLGNLLNQRGQLDQALMQYEAALAIRSRNPRHGYDLLRATYQSNIAYVLNRKGRFQEAGLHSRQALASRPDYLQAYSNLATALNGEGKDEEALSVLVEAARIVPASAEAQENAAMALLIHNRKAEAISHFEDGLQLMPDSLATLNNLAWLYATASEPELRNGPRALSLAHRAVELDRQNPLSLHKLAAAQAETGDFPSATATAEVALRLAVEQQNVGLANELRRNMDSYQKYSPLRDSRGISARPRSE